MNKNRRALLKPAVEQIQRANSLVLACHIRPDPDALGSLIGLQLGLTQLGRTVTAISPDGVPPYYRFLPGWDQVVTQTPAGATFDIGIGMDADGSDRMGSAEATILAQPCVIDLDHHTGPERYGHIQVVDPGAAATGELVFDLLTELGVEITKDIAINLMAAIITDTGGFRFSNVTAETFRIASELTLAGAHPSPIHETVYGNRSYSATKVLGHFLSAAERSADGRIVWSCVRQADFKQWGLHSGSTEGFVDQLRMVEGADVAIFFREEADGEIRVSLRSRGGFNVAQVSEEFGGGGHAAAAGCSLNAPIEEAVRRVVETVTIHMNDPASGD